MYSLFLCLKRRKMHWYKLTLILKNHCRKSWMFKKILDGLRNWKSFSTFPFSRSRESFILHFSELLLSFLAFCWLWFPIIWNRCMMQNPFLSPFWWRNWQKKDCLFSCFCWLSFSQEISFGESVKIRLMNWLAWVRFPISTCCFPSFWEWFGWSS